MKLPQVLSYVVMAAYILVWLVLLVDCLRRKKFYPVFGNGWGTKAFWLATFLLFDPLLTALYFVFGLLMRSTSPPSHLRSAVVLVPVAAVVVLFHVPIGTVGDKPSKISKDGSSPNSVVEDGGKRNTLEAQAGVLEANNSLNSTSSSSHSNNARFQCRHIAILNLSSHRLMERIGAGVQQQLAQLPFVEEVSYFPAGTGPPAGEIAPDIIVTLDLSSSKERRLPLHRSLEATILVQAGSMPYRGYSTVHDHTTPPLLRFNWIGTLSHKSKMQGYETAGAKYKMVAKNIVGEIGKTLSKQLTQWVEKHDLMPELPDAFCGTYRPAPAFPFLQNDALEQVLSTRSLFRHNRTTWRFEDDRDTTTALTSIKDQMERRGWRTNDFTLGRETSMNLRMTSGTQRLQAFRQRRERPIVMWHKEGREAERMPIVVHYENVFSEKEIEEALAGLLADDVSPDTLLIFESFFERGPLKARFFKHLEAGPVQTAGGNLTLARLYESRGDDEKARDMLMRARALARMRKNDSTLDNSIKKLAKTLGDEDLAKTPVPAEVFRNLGFIDLDNATLPFTRVVAQDEPVRVFHLDSDDKVVAIRVQVERSTGSEGKTHNALSYVAARENSRGWGTQGGFKGNNGKWRASRSLWHGDTRIRVEVEETEDGRFRFEFHRER